MGVGAKVKVGTGSSVQYGFMNAGGSYLSSNDSRLHFGLGPATSAVMEITWPGGETQRVEAARVDAELTIEQSSTEKVGPK